MLMWTPSRVPMSMVTVPSLDQRVAAGDHPGGLHPVGVVRRPAQQRVELGHDAMVVLRRLGQRLGLVELLLQLGDLVRLLAEVDLVGERPGQRADRVLAGPTTPATSFSSGCSGELLPLEW